MLKVGDKLPAGSLQEYMEVEGEGCSIGPNNFDIEKTAAGKTIAIFGLPGAFTPTCSAKHVPGSSRRPRHSRRPVLTRFGAFPSTTPM